MIVRLNSRGRIYLILSISITLLSVPVRVPPPLLLASLMIAYLVGYPLSVRDFPIPSVEFNAKLRHSVLFRGEADVLHIRVENKGREPLSLLKLRIELIPEIILIDAPDTYIFTLEPMEVKTINLPLFPIVRGNYKIGPIELSIVDPLQIFEVSIRKIETLPTRIYPKRLEGQISRARAKQILSRLIGYFALPMKGMGNDFHGLRDYIRGDPSKIVDWKASARANKLISREYEDEQQLEIIIALDAGATMRGRKFEYLIGMGMELVKGFVDEGKPTGLVLFNAETDDGKPGILHEFLPSTSPSRISNIWASIYNTKPRDDYTDYHSLDLWVEKNGVTKSLFIILGDTEGDFLQVSDAIRNIRLRGNNILFIDVWGYNFTLQHLVESSDSVMSDTSYGQIMETVIGRGLEQANVFRGLDVKKKMASYGTIYGYVMDRHDNIIEALDRAMMSYMGASWRSG